MQVRDGIVGFEVDGYFVSFPEKEEFVKEDENGNMYLLLDIYKLSGEGTLTKADKGVVTPELENKINAYVNEFLLQAASEALGMPIGEDNVED